MPIYKTTELFDLSKTIAAPLLQQCEWPWQALEGIEAFIRRLGPTLPAGEYRNTFQDVWVAVDAKVAPTAYIKGPCIIDSGAEVRHCAFIRGSTIVGKDAVVGNSTELKNAILFDGVQAPHFNYVGDSILGYKSHMGAGAITSNVKSDKTLVVVKSGQELAETGRKKVGAMLGDHAEVGCNSVLNPGSVLGKNTNVYPLSSVRGVVPHGHIYKGSGRIEPKRD